METNIKLAKTYCLFQYIHSLHAPYFVHRNFLNQIKTFPNFIDPSIYHKGFLPTQSNTFQRFMNVYLFLRLLACWSHCKNLICTTAIVSEAKLLLSEMNYNFIYHITYQNFSVNFLSHLN